MKTIGIFFGSRTPEHDVSIITAQLIIAGFKDLNYRVVPIYISKAGRWHIGKQLDSIMFFRDPAREEKLKKMKKYSLDLEASSGKMVFYRNSFMREKVEIDIAFPAMHGMHGEDGTIQGLFEMINVPYVGPGVAASAIAMDKVLTKLFYKSSNIPTVDFIYFSKNDWLENREEIEKKIASELRWPMIVKPAKLGSSIGINKTKREVDLEYAIEVALHYDDKVIVENCVEELMDLTCAVIGNDKEIEVSLLQESLFHDALFTYEDKYLKGGGAQTGEAKESIVIPARIDEQTTKEVQDLTRQIYKMVGCEGISRVDFLYDKRAKKVYANEINTIPGTLYHHLWEKSGIDLKVLLQRLIDYALERKERKDKLTMVFESDILRQVSGGKLSQKG